MTAHEANRLTAEDRDRIDAAVRRYAADSRKVGQAERLGTAVRIGWHAIGCSDADLRDSELDEIDATVRRILNERPNP